MERNAKLPPASRRANKEPRGARSAAVAAVVLTVMVEEFVAMVPEAVIVDGLKVHDASLGSPEQEREMVPVNPVEFDTETELDPGDPGAEIFTTDWFEGTVAKNPGVIVKVCEAVPSLGLKLASPL